MGHRIHQIDLLGHLLGDRVEICATARRMARPIDTGDVPFAHVTFAGGAVASVVNSVLSPREERYLRFDFSKGTAELTHLYGYGAARRQSSRPMPGCSASRRRCSLREEPTVFGSPTTEGREMAGYGGVFWRGPRSFNRYRILASGGRKRPGDASPPG